MRPELDPHPAGGVRGCVVIPAHDEAAVIARTLTPLAAAAADGSVPVIVACNGCTDETATIAAGFTGVRVVEVAAASKVAALNAADDVADALGGWPRLYLDADIEIAPETVDAVFAALRTPDGPLAARPARAYRLDETSLPVAAYYRARSRIGRLDRHLWGAGAYAVSAAGHARFGRFADVVADDLWIDRQFDATEIAVVDGVRPVAVRPPRTSRALLRTLTRVYSGNRAVVALQQDDDPAAAARTIGLAEVLRTARGPRSGLDALVYCGFAVLGRAARLGRQVRWARDETSRRSPSPTVGRAGAAEGAGG